MHTLNVKTRHRDEFVDLTNDLIALVRQSQIITGHVIVFVPHTTAGITINENADPDVKSDMIHQLDEMVPWRQAFYRHAEGNTASHVKASMMGSSVTVFIERGQLVLGTWQGIYLCEFDGPRTRKVHVKILKDA